MKRIIILVFTLVFIMSFSFNTFASDLTQKKNQIDNKIQTTKGNITSVKNQKNGIMKQIEALSNSMDDINAEIEKLDGKLDVINKNMQATQKELDELEIKRQKHYESLKIRMRDMYENSTVSYLDIFLESNSFSELLERIYNMKLIMDKDQEVLESITKLEEEVKVKKNEIEESKVELELLKSKQESSKKTMQNNIDKQSKLISQLSVSEKSFMNQLEALENEAKEVEDLINGKTKNDTKVYSGGKFIWPVPGHTYVSSGFGYRNGFRLQDGSWSPAQNHTGIDIPAPKETKIIATAAGTVITAGWVKGYGNTVIINHGSGLTSLYGHNNSLNVKVGQQVNQGDKISGCGTTGYSTGNHCHFEVRLNGKAVSPYNYLGK